MKFKSFFCMLIILVGSIFILGCQKSERNINDGYKVIDGMGTEVIFKQRPERIITLNSNLDETLLKLVGPERMVAVSGDILNPEYGLMIDVASRVKAIRPNDITPEQILALKPDLVVLQERDRTVTQTLRDLGLTVMSFPVPNSVETIEERVKVLGMATKTEEEANKIVEEMEGVLRRIDAKVANIPEQQRKIIIGYSESGAFGSSQGIFHGISTRAGAINGAALAGLEKGDHLTKEAIIKINPDVFIFPSPKMGYDSKTDLSEIGEQVMKDPAFATVAAVKNAAYVQLKDRYRYLTTPDIVIAIKILHEKLYGPLE